MALIPGAVGAAPSFPAGSGDVQFYSPSVNTDLVLGTSYAAGQVLTFINHGTANLVLKALDGSVIRTVYPATDGRVVPIQNNPSVTAHWAGIGEVVSNELAFTPVWENVTIGTGGGVTGFWKRRGRDLVCDARFVLGTGGDVTGILYLLLSSFPDSLTMNTGVIVSEAVLGVTWAYDASASSRITGVGYAPNSTKVSFFSDGAIAVWGTTSPFDWVVSDEMKAALELPITGWSATKG